MRIDAFDPICEGHRYHLADEVSLEIWQRVCRDATDGNGQRDEPRARERFHDVATRVAARGGQLRPDPGRTTLCEAGAPGIAPDSDVFASVAPGKTTQVLIDARRWQRTQRRTPVSAGAEDPPHQREVEALLGRIFSSMPGGQPRVDPAPDSPLLLRPTPVHTPEVSERPSGPITELTGVRNG